MYETYWGFKEKPFENTPDPRFIYYSRQHEEALARMMYAVREKKGAALMTGEYGCGKTLLSRVLWNELQQENRYRAVSVLDPRLSGLELLQEIAYQLSGGVVPQAKIDLFHSLYKMLYYNYNTGKHTVIVIDEAQSIRTREIFEELRLLLNFQLSNAFLLTIILLGSPELKNTIAKMPQLVQRMSVRYHIQELSEDETRQYILRRLEVAGARKNIFNEEAFKDIFICSGGVPRRINTICDLALLVAYGSGQHTVERDVILKVRDDMEFSATEIQPHNLQPIPGAPQKLPDNFAGRMADSPNLQI